MNDETVELFSICNSHIFTLVARRAYWKPKILWKNQEGTKRPCVLLGKMLLHKFYNEVPGESTRKHGCTETNKQKVCYKAITNKWIKSSG